MAMTRDIDLILRPEECYNEDLLKRRAAAKAGVNVKNINAIKFIRKSIDARRAEVKINAKVRAFIDEAEKPLFEETIFKAADKNKQVIVVGAGPAGLFAALTLLELGIKPVVLERGKSVHERRLDTAKLSREGILNEESNYAFGEGGAGAFSDGKLYTRSVKRGDVRKVLNLFVQHGADESILYEQHPHIGTDKLPKVIENIRETIRRYGGEVRFSSKMVSLIKRDDRTIGVVLSSGEELYGPVILATGHSAKDIYKHLYSSGYFLECKDTAIGVRLEHPQSLIDKMQYHNENGRGRYLPPAEYSFVTQALGRGVYSFCMCPGGVIVPAATEKGHQVVNGMSASARSGLFANSAMVAELRCSDIDIKDPLSMLEYVESIEAKAYRPGFVAPACLMKDFEENRVSSKLIKTTYPCGVESASFYDILPSFIADSLKEGFRAFGAMTRGRFLTNDAIMVGVETRTSSPVRILRDENMRQGLGLYPAGEGAGYAGGIVSAAIDGTEAAKRASEELNV